MINRACISLNARCNLRCVYCHFAAKQNNQYTKLNEFTLEDIKVFCSNLYAYIKETKLTSFKLGIVGSGEPLLSFTQLRDIVEFFYDSDLREILKMYVISNGTLLNEEIIDFFYDYQDIIELNISLDGDREINQKLRGAFPNFDIYKNKFKVMPKINAVVTKEIVLNQDRIFSFFVSNRFNKINFSKVFAIDDPNMTVSDLEYEQFLLHAKSLEIESRQNNIEKKVDCAKYGNLCGVGQNNIFVTKTGIYPCGRFMDLKDYVIGAWNEPLVDIERKMKKFKVCPKGECYFEYNKVDV